MLKSIDSSESNMELSGLRRYFVMHIDNTRKVVCNINDEFIIDQQCTQLNELIEAGELSFSQHIFSWVDASVNDRLWH